MEVVDYVGLAVVLLVVLLFSAIIARQRHMIRSPGAIALSTRRGGHRWTYGIAQYAGSELRWYRALGIGTRPTWVLRRGEVQVVGHRPPSAAERSSLPARTVVVELRRNAGTDLTVGLSESAFTGFVSWLEASAPRF